MDRKLPFFSRIEPYLAVIFAVLVFVAVDYAFADRWLSILIACVVGLVSSEFIRTFVRRKRPFSDLHSPAVIPILVLILLSVIMLIWNKL